MATEHQARPLRLRFDDFVADLGSGQLSKAGIRIKLQEQPFRALVALLERPGEVVTREELQGRLWPDYTVADAERGLNKAINRVREALGDDSEQPRFIETLPQRGYRFLVPVEPVTEIEARPPAALGIEAPPPAAPRMEASPIAAPPMGASPLPPPPSPSPNPRRRLLLVSGLAALPLAYLALRRVSARPAIESIAVLPLQNLSGRAEEEYFCDGMTDAVIGQIARIGSLRVTSRTSVMRYKAQRKSVPEIARELGVDAVLEGTVVRDGGKVRITAQLIRASDDRHLWAEEYVRDLNDVIALQSDVARAVAGQIRVQLTETARLGPARPVRSDAYDVFLRATFLVQQGMRGTLKSIELFRRAIELDDTHAESHAGLAEALCYAGIFGLRPCSETYPAARAAATRALELDETCAAAHDSLGEVKQGYDHDLAAAAAHFQRALEVNPSHLLTRLRFAENLTRQKRFDDAIAETAKTIKLDPVSPLSYANRSMIFFRARRYRQAIEVSHTALELDPVNVNALWWQGVSYAGLQDYARAEQALRKALEITQAPLFLGYLGYVFGVAGQKQKAAGVLQELNLLSRQRYVSPVDFALVYAGLGEAGPTFSWLEKAYEAREARIELPSMYYDPFRSDPRYRDLTQRFGLPL